MVHQRMWLSSALAHHVLTRLQNVLPRLYASQSVLLLLIRSLPLSIGHDDQPADTKGEICREGGRRQGSSLVLGNPINPLGTEGIYQPISIVSLGHQMPRKG